MDDNVLLGMKVADDDRRRRLSERRNGCQQMLAFMNLRFQGK